MIKVGVLGSRGRMGQTVCQTVADAEDLELTAAADIGDGRDPLAGCDVVVDFTTPATVLGNLRWCVDNRLNAVVGTSGFDQDKIAEVADWLGSSPQARVLIVPNFSIGAILMMRFAEQAARFFPSAEIIEMHHAGKADAPSGTAIRTADLIEAERQAARSGPPPDATVTELPGARGARLGAVRVHSVRLAGLVAHQEVLLGAPGETLRIRHDSLDRVSFMPGVLVAIRGVGSLKPGLTVGIDGLLGLT